MDEETKVIDKKKLVELLECFEEDVEYKKNIFIIGEVNENIANEVIREMVEADWDSDSIKELNIYINSQGGFLSDCFAIIDLILDYKKRYNLTVNTYGLGEVASAGFFLFLLGDNRILHPSCRVFVHSHITIGDEKTFVERVKADKTEEKELYDNYVKYVSQQLQISTQKAKNLLKKGKWLNKKEVRDYSIHKIKEEKQE